MCTTHKINAVFTHALLTALFATVYAAILIGGFDIIKSIRIKAISGVFGRKTTHILLEFRAYSAGMHDKRISHHDQKPGTPLERA